MTQQPAASAGATFHEDNRKGKFHGTMAATTPTGSLSVNKKASERLDGVVPAIFVAAPA